MNPIEPPTDSPDDRPNILERLRAVDVSRLDQLIELRGEQQRLERYAAKADELKEGVLPAVHARVMEDYKKRLSALALQSTPLRAEARAEYRKLKQLVSEVDQADEQARLEKDELDFRHAVGELDEAQLGQRLEGPLGVIERCQKDRAVLDEQAARFLEALGPEEPPSAVDPELIETATAEAPETLPGAKRARTRAAAVAQVDAPSQSFVLEPGADEPPSPAALLLSETPTAPPREYRLAAVNRIGRSDESEIQVVKPGVSRMHAVVSIAADGFSIKDLGSQNGTFVNGEPAIERQLADGDAIDLGTVRLIFRMPWPAPMAATRAK